MSNDQLPSELIQLLPALGQQPSSPEVIERLRPLADAGDKHATVLLAWALAQAGRVPEGIPYARRAANAGAAQVANIYAGSLFGMPDSTEDAMDLLDAALRGGVHIDPLAWLPALAQRGDYDGAARLVEFATRSWLPPAPQDWDRLLNELQTSRNRFLSEIEQVENQRDDSIASIRGHEAAIEGERARLAALGHKVEVLAHEAAADELSREYANQATSTERSAFRFTAGALLVGAGAAALAAYFTLEQAREQNPDVLVGVAKAAIAIPIALFAAYLGRLAGNYRQVAWRWRHTELQLRTAEPYIAELDDGRRQELIEALALRFFPGQPIHPEADGSSQASDPSPISIQLGQSRNASPAAQDTSTSPPVV